MKSALQPLVQELPRTNRKSALGHALVTLLLTLCSGCRESSVPAVQRLRPLPDTPAPGEREDRLVRRLVLPGDIEPGSIEGSAWTADPDPAASDVGGTRIAVGLPGDLHVQIPIRDEVQTFNRVGFRFETAEPLSVVMLARRSGEPVALTHTLTGREGEQIVWFDVPPLRSEGPVRSLGLRVHRATGPWRLGPIDLAWRPDAGWLPDPRRPELVRIRDQARQAAGLTHDAALSADFAAPPNGRLVVECGRPTQQPWAEREAQLAIAVAAGDRVVSEHTLDLPATADAGWERITIDLADEAGESLTVRFSVPPGQLVALAEPLVYTPRADAPFVLVVTSDTHRADHLAATGSAVQLETPALDALARRGVLFETCWSSTNVTIPSHTAILTGVHPRDSEVTSNTCRVDEGAYTLAEAFRDSGFVCWSVVSTKHLANSFSGLGQGFDRFSPPPAGASERRAPASVALLQSWLAESEGLPVFVWLHVNDAHGPYDPPEPWNRRFWSKDADPFDAALPEPEFPIPRDMPGLRDLDWGVAQYAGEVGFLDQHLGPLFEEPRVRDGIVAFTADHGECLIHKQFGWSHKGLLTDTINVPLVLAWPGSPAGLRVRKRVDQLDLARTLLDLAGLEDVDFPGQNLSASFGDDSFEAPVFALSNRSLSASVTRGRWHLILRLRAGAISKHRVGLYDLETDPSCLTDVAEEELDRAAELRALLIAWIRAAEPTGWGTEATLGADDQAHLAAMGYLDNRARAEVPELQTLMEEGCECMNCALFE